MVWPTRTDDGLDARTLLSEGRRRGGARSNGTHALAKRGHPACDAQPAAHAELIVNGVVECASGRAPRSTAAAWDKRETIAW